MYMSNVYAGGETMVRTQIYLTQAERDALSRLSSLTGRSQSDLIREAIDGLIRAEETDHRHSVLEQTAGMWSDRDDLPDFNALRYELDRNREHR